MSNIPAVGDKVTAAWGDLIAQPFYGEFTSGTATTLSTTAFFAASATVTFTLPTQMRVRIYGISQFVMNTNTNGIYVVNAAYNTGASANIASVVRLGVSTTTNLAATALRVSASAEGTVLLAAGQYTAYLAVQRSGGGGATDISGNNYVSVLAVGFV